MIFCASIGPHDHCSNIRVPCVTILVQGAAASMTEGKDVFTEDEIKEMFGEAFDQVRFSKRGG
jgi:hypothetical protein